MYPNRDEQGLDVLYHVAQAEDVPSIEEHGLRGTYGDCGFGVYLWTNIYAARTYAEEGGWDPTNKLENPVIIRVHTDEALSCEEHMGGLPVEWEEERAKYEETWLVPLEEPSGEIENYFKPADLQVLHNNPMNYKIQYILPDTCHYCGVVLQLQDDIFCDRCNQEYLAEVQKDPEY